VGFVDAVPVDRGVLVHALRLRCGG
jgi:hypothetical protein